MHHASVKQLNAQVTRWHSVITLKDKTYQKKLNFLGKKMETNHMKLHIKIYSKFLGSTCVRHGWLEDWTSTILIVRIRFLFTEFLVI